MIRKILKYRILIFQTLSILSKYMFMRALYTDRGLLRIISDQQYKKKQYTVQEKKQPFQALLRTVNKILGFIYPDGNCLIKSLVKRDILLKNGFSEQIACGIITTEQGIKAHAWLIGEYEANFKIVHLL